MSTKTASAVAPASPDWGAALDLSVVSPAERDFVKFIDRVIIGQSRGRRAAQRAFRRTLSKLRMDTAPIYSILALGPTTCGKSELAYRLAEFLHGNREALLKLDGSEYMDDSRLTHLIGGTAQWVGFVDKNRPDYVPPKPDEKDTSCELNNHNLEFSRRGSKSPVNIVLVDEWDKACLEFNNIMLSILRTGKYTLGNGEVVDFRNTIFIFTANLGARDVEREKEKAKNPIGFGSGNDLTPTQVEELFTKHLKSFTAPEFRARIVENGEVVIFDALTTEQVGHVRDLKVEDMAAFISANVDVQLTVDAAARQRLLEMALANDGTVANLNGVLKTEITDNIDNQLIIGGIAGKDHILVTVASEGGPVEMRKAVKKLVFVTGTDDPEFLAATAEADAQFAAAEGKRRRGPGEVDVDAVRRAGEEMKRAAAAQPKVLQPFMITVVTATPEGLVQAMRDLDVVFAKHNIVKAAQETKFGVVIQTHAGYVRGDLTEIRVSADIHDMVAFRQEAPLVDVATIATSM
jgi:hypothetical protein